jgi:hypothetical protein
VDESSILLTVFLTIMIQAVAVIENNRHFQAVRQEMITQTERLSSASFQQSFQQWVARSESQSRYLHVKEEIEQGFKERKAQMDLILKMLPSPTPAVPFLPLKPSIGK